MIESNDSGFTFIELVATFSVLSIVVGSILMALLSTQNVFLDNQALSQLNLRAQLAMDRVAALSSQALTTDAEFGPLKPATGIDSHALQFRLIDSIDPDTGEVIYNDAVQVFICGPDSGSNPCAGLIIGRGPGLDDIYNTGKGADGLLGTEDDNTSALFSGVPAVELLVSSRYAPRTGEMFTVNLEPAPAGRLITFTLRINVRDSSGSLLLPNDLELRERVALRQ
ncbi:MAG: type II secretion system protein [Planctomycetes bacterium]|nr:type II secretion system protein [Planctomycetota bacterium]